MFNLIYKIGDSELTLTVQGTWTRPRGLELGNRVPEPFLTEKAAMIRAEEEIKTFSAPPKGTFRAVPV